MAKPTYVRDERPAVMEDLIRSTDIVTVVGYGGLVRSLVGICKEIHITEMRPSETFITTVIGRVRTAIT